MILRATRDEAEFVLLAGKSTAKTAEADCTYSESGGRMPAGQTIGNAGVLR
jgi:hypothetical protein